MAVKVFVLSALLTLACHGTLVAATGLGIAFRLNDTVVTDFDLENMMKFIAIIEGRTIADYTGRSRDQLRERAIGAKAEQLIKQQEAARHNISVSDQELASAMSAIPGTGRLKETLRANNVPQKVYEDMIRSDLLWMKLIRQQYMERVYPSAQDIANHMRQNPMDDMGTAVNRIVSSRLEQAAFTRLRDLQRRVVIEK